MKLGVLVVVLVGMGVVGCWCTPKLESAVDVPITVEAAQKLHAPPDVIVTVERITTKPSGGAGCGHSPLCLIILPVILVEEMFPPKHDEVVIVDHGVEVYRGSFKTNGDFLQARATKDGIVRDMRQLNLKELSKRVVVEVARSPSPGAPPAPVPLSPQANLLEAYAQAMGRPGHAQCGELVVEALTWLGAEAHDFARTQLAKPEAEWPDKCKASVAAHLCGTERTAAQLDIVAAAGATSGPLTAAVVIRGCVARTEYDREHDAYPRMKNTLDDARSDPFVRTLVSGLCTRKLPESDYDEATKLADLQLTSSIERIFASEPACQEPGPATYMDVKRHRPLDATRVEAALATAWGSDIVRRMRVKEHEAFIVKALENNDTAVAALAVLQRGGEEPLRTGGAELARLYARGVPSSFCTDDEGRVQIVDHLLVLPPEQRAAALQVLRAAKQSDVVGAARRALGDAQPETFSGGVMATFGSTLPCNDDQTAAIVLKRGGCAPASKDPGEKRVACASASGRSN